ncbi:MAG: ATP-binding protein [Steroidobacteraceae bacterium]
MRKAPLLPRPGTATGWLAWLLILVAAGLTQLAIQPQFRIPLPGGIPFGLMGAPSLAAALLTGPLGALAALPLVIKWQSLPAVATLLSAALVGELARRRLHPIWIWLGWLGVVVLVRAPSNLWNPDPEQLLTLAFAIISAAANLQLAWLVAAPLRRIAWLHTHRGPVAYGHRVFSILVSVFVTLALAFGATETSYRWSALVGEALVVQELEARSAAASLPSALVGWQRLGEISADALELPANQAAWPSALRDLSLRMLAVEGGLRGLSLSGGGSTPVVLDVAATGMVQSGNPVGGSFQDVTLFAGSGLEQTRVALGRAGSGQWLVRVGTLLQQPPAGTPLLLDFYFDADRLYRSLEGMRQTRNDRVWVLNAEGSVISGPQDASMPSEVVLDAEALARLGRWRALSVEGWLESRAPIEGLDWIVAVHRPVAELFPAFRLSTARLSAYISGTIVLALLLSLLITRSFLDPLDRLIRQVTASRSGEEDTLPKMADILEIRRFGALIRRAQQRQVRARRRLDHLLRELDSRVRVRTAELAASENRWRLTAELAPEPMIVVDQDSSIVFANRALHELAGWDEGQLVGEKLDVIVPEHLRAGHHTGMNRYLETGIKRISWRGTQIKLRHVSGALVPVEISFGEFNTAGRRLFVGYLTDVTARQQREEALIAARNSAEAASQAKNRYVATISHEMRTPLHGLLALLGLLGKESLSTVGRERLEGAVAGADALLSLANDVLDLGQLERGELKVDLEPFGPRRMVRDVVVALSEQARQAGLLLDYSVDPEVASLLQGDRARIRQILINLVGNALKFTERGSVSVRMYRGESGHYLFEVTDTGPGVPEHLREEIFEWRAQANLTDARKGRGLGLGLAISRGLAEAMGGTLRCESGAAVGATFVLDLPLAEIDVQAQASSVGSQPSTRQLVDPAQVGKVLVVDDNPANRMVLQAFLQQLGIPCEVAVDGHACLRAVTETRFGVVLLDIRMPGLDGYDVARRIRLLNIEQPRLVAVTASAEPDEERFVREAGMDALLTKPFGVEQLDAVLGSLFAEGGAVPEASTTAPGVAAVEAGPPPLLGGRAATVFGRGDEFRHPLRKAYEANCRATRQQLDEAIAASDVASCCDLLHGLKGASAMLGLERMARLSAALEQRVKAQGVAAAGRGLPELDSSISATLEALEEMARG